ncbi:conserved hypothetical protein [uncultured Sporomusa sp.]|uniref:Uncharacterized protein n=1 Tax=uncultured Sporomusa sp. TaxID=307249 RepID=A0A212LVQ9_9FIRM|nr:hypothetical protein [uncultured Sporomusa sp.]SCM81591.1 conserved hypothetical protein [uncultured Sporomusa sp.]
MSADRFDHLEKMLAQLIHMVGHNNGVTEELCQRMDRLETRMDSLETKLDNLEVKVNSLETKLDNLEAKVNSLETQVNNGFEGLTGMVQLLGEKTEAIPRIESKLDVLNGRLFEQEAEINMLKRAK